MTSRLVKHFIYTTLFYLAATTALGQQVSLSQKIKTDNPLKSRIDRIVQEYATAYLSSPNTFNLSVGIYDKGNTYEYNYAKDKDALPNGNTFYGIGSIAKTFTGWMLANAVVEQKVKLTDDIRKYFPVSYPNLVYEGHPIQVQHLANHTSGLPELSRPYSDAYLDSIVKLPPQGLKHFYNSYTADSLLADMHHFTVDTIPGTAYRYNGNAMMVLIALLQQVYHRPYPSLITTYLQHKYQMTNTRPALSKEEEKLLPAGHDDKGNILPLVVDEGFRGAPNMFSTPNDMLRYIKANLNTRDAVTTLSHQPTYTTADGMQLGLNWMMGKEDDGCRYIMHTGRDGFGFTALCFMYPEQQAGIVLFVNETTPQENLSALKENIRLALFKKKP